MHAIEHTYISLLADVADLSGFSEIRGSYESLQWCLHEAPKLEKYTARCVELGEEPDPARYPVWLRRLALASVKDAMKMRYLRQLLLFCYKAHVQHDKTKTEAAFRSFIDTNRSVAEFANGLAKAYPRLFNRARQHCQSVLYRGRWKEILPQHGPGASISPKDKWTRWFDSIEHVWPGHNYFVLANNEEHCSEYMDRLDCGHIEAKLIAVPKDSRGPRLICVHPAEAIWIQQGLRVATETAIGLRRSAKGPWPSGHVHFDDQSVNGRIALLSSRSRQYATLDMKEASDRISDILVQALFGPYYKYFGSCRAQKFFIPKGAFLKNEVLEDDLHSYAPMGNATTFPVQSLVFWAICCASLQSRGCNAPGAVFVFGDDIIVPSQYAEGVCEDLETFGLVVNKDKSFWRGAFRESCGVDAFNGVDVTPVRWKTSLDAEHLPELLALSDIAMRLRMRGYEKAAATAYATLRATFLRGTGRRVYCTNNPHHGGIAEYVTLDSKVWGAAKWRRNEQWFHTVTWRVEDRWGIPAMDRWNDILESILGLARRGKDPYRLSNVHRVALEQRGLSRGLSLKRGWTQVL